MSKDRQSPPVAQTNLQIVRAKLKAAGQRQARQVWSWVLDHWQLSAILAGVVVLTIPILVVLVIQQHAARQARPTSHKMAILLQESLTAVAAGKYTDAREMLKRLDLAFLEQEHLTAVEYMLGAVVADEADEYVGVDRAARYRLAASHLKKSHEQGFPYRHETAAAFLLGKCLFHGGNVIEARVWLEESLQAVPHERTQIHLMLAESYRAGTSADYARSLSHNNEYLKSNELTVDQREQAVLRQAELYWKLGQIAACSESLDKIAALSPLATNAAILRGRLLLHRAEVANASLAADADEAAKQSVEEKFREAVSVLRRAQQDPLNTHVLGPAMYLIGVCYLKLGQTDAALDQLSRTSRVFVDTPEGLAAGLEQADLLRRLARHEEALAQYLRVLEGIAPTLESETDNPWISREQFRNRVVEAYNHYLLRGDYVRAEKFVAKLAPLVRPARTAELAAELYRDWARQALDEADQASEPAASEARRRGRKLLREAGLRYAAAARLNFTERQYTEDVWEAAEAYRSGHNFTAAAKWYEEYLKYEVKRRRSSALVGWGECLLSLGRIRAALETFKQCYELSPQDIASYSARLLASQAYLQLDQPKQAEVLLRENIAGNLLTPASREWRESLFALGKLLSRQQRHEEAINVLSEYVSRYPDSRDSIEARYNIAEEYRRAAKEPQQLALADAIETSRLAHLKVVQKYLTAAVTHYEEVQHLLNRRQEREELSPRDQALLRNSYFAAGVAFTDLGRYEDAIRAYATATNHYQHAPEVLEAFVQIAGCYRRLNRPLEARGTIRQAKVVLDRLPADAPYQQTTNFSRTQWAELLDWMITL